MVHIAMQQNDESGNPVTWGRQVTEEEYREPGATIAATHTQER
jgi:hypothetical protein